MFWKRWFKSKNKSIDKVEEEKEIYNKTFNSLSNSIIKFTNDHFTDITKEDLNFFSKSRIENVKKLVFIRFMRDTPDFNKFSNDLYFFKHYKFTEKNEEVDLKVYRSMIVLELVALTFGIFKPGHIEKIIYHNPYIKHFMENYEQYESFFLMFVYNIILTKKQQKYGELLYPIFVFSYLLNMILVYEKENKKKDEKNNKEEYLCLSEEYKKSNIDFPVYTSLLFPLVLSKELIKKYEPLIKGFQSEVLNNIIIPENLNKHPIKMFKIKNINYKMIYQIIAFPPLKDENGTELILPSTVFSAYPILNKYKTLKNSYHLPHYANEVIECFKIDRIRHIAIDVVGSFNNHFEALCLNETMSNTYDLIYKIPTDEFKKNLDMMLIFKWLNNLHSHTGEKCKTLIYLDSKSDKTRTYNKSFVNSFYKTYINDIHLKQFSNIYLLSKISVDVDNEHETSDFRFNCNLIIDITKIDKKYLSYDKFDSKVSETYDKAKIVSYDQLVVIEKFLKNNPNYTKYKNTFMRYFDKRHYYRVFDKDNDMKSNSDLELNSYYDTSLINIKDNDIKTIIRGCKNYCNRSDFVNLSIICYGDSGNSKSTLGVYLSKVLNKKLTTISGSSIVTKWVGESEKNVKDIFHTMDKNDLLLIEEADSLFVSRDNEHSQTWNRSLTNEWLVQLERFKGVLVVTTNHIKNFDQAMLRRFTLKYEFLDLKPELYYKALKPHILKHKMKNDMTRKEIENSLSGLRLGDIGNVEKLIHFYKIKTVSSYVNYLQKEISMRDKDSEKIKVGFIEKPDIL